MANVDCRIARALQSYTITYPSPDETLLASPQALPTSEPATPQIEFTIRPQHLPTVSPAGLEYTLTAILYAAGKNTDAASQTVYYRILRNGASVATGSASVAANYYYTWTHCRFLGVQIGETVACKLWASSTSVNWDYKALALLPTRCGPYNQVLRDIVYATTSVPALALGVPRAFSRFQGRLWHLDALYVPFSTDSSALILLPQSTCRLIGLYAGDEYLFSSCHSGTTYRPDYDCSYVPTAISFRPLTLRV